VAILPIRRFPDPVLKEKALPVEKIDKEIKKLIKNMADTMYDAPGVGLAANQVGVLKQIVVIDVDDELLELVNPNITFYSDEIEDGEEGCLSVGAEIQIVIPRSVRVVVETLNGRGEKIEIEAEGMLARALQHEIDHINGITILDRTSPEEKRRALRELSTLLR
jgi:peptide deformylase